MKTFLLAFSCLFTLSSAQFDSICAGDNGNTACCVNTGNVPSQDSTYMFMPEDIAANQLLFCNINGGRLAYIETIAENDCLNQYIQEEYGSLGEEWLIGLKDQDVKGTWKWYITGSDDGTSAEMQHWAPTPRHVRTICVAWCRC